MTEYAMTCRAVIACCSLTVAMGLMLTTNAPQNRTTEETMATMSPFDEDVCIKRCPGGYKSNLNHCECMASCPALNCSIECAQHQLDIYGCATCYCAPWNPDVGDRCYETVTRHMLMNANGARPAAEVRSLGECLSICYADVDCQGVDWNTDGGFKGTLCWKHYAEYTLKKNRRVDHFVFNRCPGARVTAEMTTLSVMGTTPTMTKTPLSTEEATTLLSEDKSQMLSIESVVTTMSSCLPRNCPIECAQPQLDTTGCPTCRCTPWNLTDTDACNETATMHKGYKSTNPAGLLTEDVLNIGECLQKCLQDKMCRSVDWNEDVLANGTQCWRYYDEGTRVRAERVSHLVVNRCAPTEASLNGTTPSIKDTSIVTKGRSMQMSQTTSSMSVEDGEISSTDTATFTPLSITDATMSAEGGSISMTNTTMVMEDQTMSMKDTTALESTAKSMTPEISMKQTTLIEKMTSITEDTKYMPITSLPIKTQQPSMEKTSFSMYETTQPGGNTWSQNMNSMMTSYSAPVIVVVALSIASAAALAMGACLMTLWYCAVFRDRSAPHAECSRRKKYDFSVNVHY